MGSGWQVEAAFTSCIKIPFIAVFFRKWPPACDAISRRRSFASALWWKLFFSQQAVISMNCQTCTLKIWSHFKRKRRADRGALRNCVAGYFGADSLWSCCVGSMVKNRSGMKNLLVNHIFFFFSRTLIFYSKWFVWSHFCIGWLLNWILKGLGLQRASIINYTVHKDT